MADWYVDLSASSNGDGSTSSPWNQFTSTENASVNAGDRVWFRRITSSKTLSLKAGDTNNSIYYIGWPKPGDDFYDIRDSGLATNWDLDSNDYYNCHRLVDSSPVLSTASYTELHRFYVKNTRNYYTGRPLSLQCNNITHLNIKKCKVDKTMAYDYYKSSSYRTLVIQSSDNITFEDSYIYAPTAYGDKGCCFCYIKDSSNIQFNDTIIQISADNRCYTSYLTIDQSYISTITNSSTVFDNCTFVWDRRTSSHANTTGSVLVEILVYNHSNVTINDCNITTNSTDYGNVLPNYALVSLFSGQGNVNITISNTTFNADSPNCSLLCIGDNCIATLTNVDWTATTTPTALLVVDTENTNLTLTNISCDVLDSSPSITGFSYFIVTRYVGFINVPEHIQFNNITNLNKCMILERGRDTPVNIDANPSHPYNKLGYVLTRASKLNLQPGYECSSVYLYYNTEDSNNYIYGSEKSLNIEANQITFLNSALGFNTTYNRPLYANITLCSGINNEYNIINPKPTNTYIGCVKLIRNSGFKGLGWYPNSANFELFSTFNNFDEGTTTYVSHQSVYKTDIAKRDSGAGYSIKLQYNQTEDDVEITYPQRGYDMTWLYLPASGTHTANAYIAYTVSGTYTLTSDDVYTNTFVINDYPIKVKSDNFIIDNSSTWHDLPADANYLKLVSQIYVTRPQYCPIELVLEKNLPDLKVYFDPKVEVIS